jgi:hypothetical protein
VSTIEAFPVGFYCEHQETTARVMALVKNGDRLPVLVPVVLVPDDGLAHRVACLLNGLRAAGTAIQDEVGDVERLLPDDQRSAYRAAVGQLTHRMWPAPPRSPRDIEMGPPDRFHSSDDEAQRTPYEKLAGLPGQTVRLWRLTELHVFDRERFLHAAATGPTYTEQDPDQIVEAALVLLDDEAGLPGADQLLDEYVGETLEADDGDELGAFRPLTPPEFEQTGWRAGEVH